MDQSGEPTTQDIRSCSTQHNLDHEAQLVPHLSVISYTMRHLDIIWHADVMWYCYAVVLFAWLFSDAGSNTCGGRPGSRGSVSSCKGLCSHALRLCVSLSICPCICSTPAVPCTMSLFVSMCMSMFVCVTAKKIALCVTRMYTLSWFLSHTRYEKQDAATYAKW